ncbi:MucB/RseB C-terminal domain-containing protein [Chromobacterium sp. IIBBL 290-4]|uniref:MucB/RseB C-terminal domain-containing protein n=1 Tax=Chromobacterium sp. IIBBL 290-4 TaxID=2953890 RepID=UPI0020B6FD36|nr:MucB/RseB C-terminal domain-containing protein [Chromobacterium sp. IIBBL 290-4]UTH73708.1 MucB/RseB C-terminal domain-containing protein [Chromobacterium sp. IIBBL 290-4]
MRVVPLIGVMMLGAGAAAHAEDDVQLLRNVGNAGLQQQLDGTYLHQMNGMLETFRIVRQGQGDNVREKRTSLDGPSREVVRQGNELTCYASDKRALMACRISAMRLFPAMLPDDVEDISRSYVLKRTGHDRVAQRDCQWLDLQPRDQQRYTLRLCIEPTSYLPLKAITLTPRGDAVEQFTFTNVELVGAKDKKAYKPRLAQKMPIGQGRMMGAGADEAAQSDVTGLPQGFRLLRSAQRVLPGAGNKQVRNMVLSDGLVMLSVFAEPAPSDNAKLERAGNLHGAINMATSYQNDVRLTAVGDLPPTALIALLKGMHIKGD